MNDTYDVRGIREMTPAELRANAGIMLLLKDMTFSDAMGVLVNALVAASIHMEMPRSVFEAICMKTWDAIAEANLPTKEGSA